MVAELLARVYIGDVYLDGRNRDSFDGIVDGNGGVGVCSSVEDDAVAGRGARRVAPVGRVRGKGKVGIVTIPCEVNAVDDVAFVVGLEVVDLDIGISLTQCFEEVLESLCTVDAGFAMAQEVEVGAVDDEDMHMVEG